MHILAREDESGGSHQCRTGTFGAGVLLRHHLSPNSNAVPPQEVWLLFAHRFMCPWSSSNSLIQTVIFINCILIWFKVALYLEKENSTKREFGTRIWDLHNLLVSFWCRLRLGWLRLGAHPGRVLNPQPRWSWGYSECLREEQDRRRGKGPFVNEEMQ